MEADTAQIAVDVVISTFGGSRLIEATIASIRASTHANFTLWVLDQNSDDLTRDRVERHAAVDARVRYLRVPLRGLTTTRNVGAGLGTAPIILFTNDDCRVAPGWIGAMAAELGAGDTWLACGRVLPDESGRTGADDERIVLATQGHDRREVFDGNRRALNYIQGHNFGLRRDAFARLRGFDEQLGAGKPLRSADERDIAYRTSLRGARVVYTPDALVYHNHWLDQEGIEKSFDSYAIGMGALAAKYLRCGRFNVLILIAQWIKVFGVEWMIEGLTDRRKRGRVRIAARQYVYLTAGLLQALRYRVDRQYMLFVPDDAGQERSVAFQRQDVT